MHARNLRVPGFAMAVFAICAAAAQPTRQDLHLGAEIERPLSGGEAHSYGVEAKPGARLLVTVEQRGIDVVVEMAQADGRTLLAVDSPSGGEGPESVLIPAEASGPLDIRVLSPSPGARRGGTPSAWRSWRRRRPPTASASKPSG